ncbi:MAG TPA: hypothetical protein VJL58_00995 [Pyrinomonadaceae bacterium]|nr:hypothetical protein [Pyrinomonadaceae bacterium]
MKRLSTIVGLMLALLAGFTVESAAQSGLGQAQRVTGDRFAFAARTPRGANIYSVRRPSGAMLNAIDRGLSDLFAAARRNGYSRGLNYGQYTIYIANADRNRDSSGRYSPDIAVGAAQYAGSVYDQGGYVFAAGMVIGFNPMSFVIAEHTQNLERVAEVVRYEGEHLILYHNDRRRYSQTADHSRGGGHPILQ